MHRSDLIGMEGGYVSWSLGEERPCDSPSFSCSLNKLRQSIILNLPLITPAGLKTVKTLKREDSKGPLQYSKSKSQQKSNPLKPRETNPQSDKKEIGTERER